MKIGPQAKGETTPTFASLPQAPGAVSKVLLRNPHISGRISACIIGLLKPVLGFPQCTGADLGRMLGRHSGVEKREEVSLHKWKSLENRTG